MYLCKFVCLGVRVVVGVGFSTFVDFRLPKVDLICLFFGHHCNYRLHAVNFIANKKIHQSVTLVGSILLAYCFCVHITLVKCSTMTFH